MLMMIRTCERRTTRLRTRRKKEKERREERRRREECLGVATTETARTKRELLACNRQGKKKEVYSSAF